MPQHALKALDAYFNKLSLVPLAVASAWRLSLIYRSISSTNYSPACSIPERAGSAASQRMSKSVLYLRSSLVMARSREICPRPRDPLMNSILFAILRYYAELMLVSIEAIIKRQMVTKIPSIKFTWFTMKRSFSQLG